VSKVRVFIQFVVGVMIVGILVNLVSDYLGNHYRSVERILIELTLAGVLIWALILITEVVLTRFSGCRYAVEALILNSRDELLLWRHPYHKCMLPPGGRVKRGEFPNQALRSRLQERLGLGPSQYRFDGRFHHGINENSGNLGEVQRLAAPFLVQRELHRQRAFVKSHYDFIYVLKLVADDINLDLPRYSPVHFVDIEALKEMVSQGRTYPDVLDAYRRILNASAREPL